MVKKGSTATSDSFKNIKLFLPTLTQCNMQSPQLTLFSVIVMIVTGICSSHSSSSLILTLLGKAYLTRCMTRFRPRHRINSQSQKLHDTMSHGMSHHLKKLLAKINGCMTRIVHSHILNDTTDSIHLLQLFPVTLLAYFNSLLSK